MIYVMLAEHTADICPTANARTHEVMLKGAPEIPNLAKRHGIKVLSGPWVNREHLTVMVVESEKSEALDQFISESGLAQWNRVRILPSLDLMGEGMKDVQRSKPIF